MEKHNSSSEVNRDCSLNRQFLEHMKAWNMEIDALLLLICVCSIRNNLKYKNIFQ